MKCDTSLLKLKHEEKRELSLQKHNLHKDGHDKIQKAQSLQYLP